MVKLAFNYLSFIIFCVFKVFLNSKLVWFECVILFLLGPSKHIYPDSVLSLILPEILFCYLILVYS